MLRAAVTPLFDKSGFIVINEMPVRRTLLVISQQLLATESLFVISGYRRGVNNIFAFLWVEGKVTGSIPAGVIGIFH